jgi:hypothetical protein
LRGKQFKFVKSLLTSEDWDLLWVERDSIYEILNHFHLQAH